MQNYHVLAMIIQIVVDFLLIVGVSRLCDYPCTIYNAITGSLLGGAISAAIIVFRITLRNEWIWHFIFILLECAVVFGVHKNEWRPGVIYLIFRIAMHEIITATGKTETIIWILLLGGAWIWGTCGKKQQRFVPVVLEYRNKIIKLRGLVDTGNTLKDPVTGKCVLVVGSDVANVLTGLTDEQLRKPVDSIGVIPGLRLIPYKTINQTGSFLLAMCLKNSVVGREKGCILVAFAPQVLDEFGRFQALVGG